MDWSTYSPRFETKAKGNRFHGMKRNTKFVLQCLAAAIISLILTTCGRQSESNRDTQIDDTTAIRHMVTPDSLAIIPGKSVGMFKLGDADSVVQQQFGQPDYSDAGMGKAVLLWYTDTTTRYPLSIFTARDMGNDETARIQQIRVTSPAFKTGRALGVGSTLAEIRSHDQITLIETYKKNGETYSVYDSDAGIAFELGPDDRCVAIIIHPVDADVATYLPLRPVD